MKEWAIEKGRGAEIIVALFALAIHVLFVWETRTDIFTTPLVDAYAYHQQAVDILQGRIEPKPFWQPPLFPYWLALVYRFAGPDPAAARYYQAIWTVLAAVGTFVLARRFLPSRSALTAGLLLPLYGPLLFLSAQLMPTGMAVALDLTVLVAFLRLQNSPTVGRALILGLLIGVAALAVPNILVFLLVILGWVFLFGFRNGTRRGTVFLGASVLLGVTLVLLPVACRNAVVSGEWIPISTNGGINLYIGNNPEAARTIAVRPGPDGDQLIHQPDGAGCGNSPAEAQRYFVREVVQYAVTQPLSFFQGLAVKAWHFAHSIEIPRNLDIYVMRDYSVFLNLLVWKWGSFAFPFGVLLPLAVVGLMWTDRRKEGWNVLACFVIVYGTSVVLFFPASRYRLPIVPPLLIFAVAGGAELVSAWKSSRRRMSYGLAAMVGVGCLIALPARFPTDHVTFAAELHNDVGVSLQREHQYTASLMHLLRAAKADPSNSVVHSNLACVMARLEDYGRAKFSCRRALQARPDYVDALAMLGGVLCTEREFAEAETCYRQWTRLNPSDGVSWNNLGFSLLWQRRYAEALDCLATALRVAGPHAKVMVNLGETLMGLGRFQEAVRCFRKALSLEPDNAEIRRELDMAALKIKDGGSRF